MDSGEVDRLAKKLNIGPGWRGVVAADHVAGSGMQVGNVCVVNCCTADRPGRHWLAVHRVTSTSWELFDSSGSHPRVWRQLQVPAWWGDECAYSAERLQHPAADTCGLYAVVYCLERSAGLDMPTILSRMLHSRHNLRVNDQAIFARTRV